MTETGHGETAKEKPGTSFMNPRENGSNKMAEKDKFYQYSPLGKYVHKREKERVHGEMYR